MKSLQLPPFKEKNVLITGGAGFLGSNLARRLLQQGAILTLFLKKGEDWFALEANSAPAFDFFECEREKLAGMLVDLLKEKARK